jgi:CRP-like cAMP-binding protein/DNA-binding NarL/FixJ family response regulator
MISEPSIASSAIESKANIIIIEDDPIIALDIRKILTKNNYTVLQHYDSGEEFLSNIEKYSPDIILMDINLKGELDGIDTALQLLKVKNIPVIFLTALSDEATLSRAKLTKPFGYVVKPFEEADIVTAIEIAKSRFDDGSLDGNSSDGAIVLEDTLNLFEDIDEESKLNAEQIRSIKIFEKLSEAESLSVINSSVVKAFSAGDIIISPENKDYGFVVLSGRVGIVSTSSMGKDLVSILLGPGDSFGLYFTHENFSEKLYAKAQSDSRVLLLPAALISRLIRESKGFTGEYISELCTYFSKIISISQALAFSKVEGRIINTLLALLPNFGKKVKDLENAGRLFITRKELADLTGTTPETAIRVTKALERRDLLDLTKPGIIKIPDIRQLQLETYE